ncbi:type VI secretion system protein TssL, long form [Limnobacter parvus]|uniref:Type VI secretion system protein TssL, long form n=1 Tax=Limnobacter parvus TaxID=2939690 RepID=A0ABT1XIR7_9BURK|nr:type VI secretion system protein TssL, long form [Limnobacter parvus]MCR2747165.1 type VI secretion system protein TssL, long form [Limnobacter parvus]
MNADDPFFALGGERTIIKPRLGKPASAAIQSLDNILGPSESVGRVGEAEHSHAQARFDHMLSQLQNNPAASENGLLVHASPLLRMICAVGDMVEVPSAKALSNTMLRGLRELDQTLEQMRRPQAERLSVRYVLCTFMDERAANTPWGGSGQWANHSLLLQFFSETWGGEKVFALIQKLMQSPAENKELLELMAVVLSLGFKGKYKVETGGDIALVQLRTSLFQLVQSHPLHPLAQLHPDFWKSKAPASRKSFLQIPLWLPISVLSTLGTLFFLGLYFNMNTQSDQAFAEITSISFPAPEFTQIAAAPVNPVFGLELPVQLQQEIMAGLLTLKQLGNKSTVILVGDGLFDSGSAELSAKAAPLVDKVAKELSLHPGQITVTGYTDNQPIRSIRFPSNWQLSAERAEHVGQRIAAFLPNTAIATEGAGAANPIAPNNTAQGRALNRRVEITLIHSQ